MSKFVFNISLVLITILGLSLRLIDYDKVPPFGETMDEFMYPWAGITFLKTGVPASWSLPFPSYKKENIVNLFNHWGVGYYIVSPWVEKPPLYPLITGTVALIAKQDDLPKVRLSTIRLVPITLSLFTILLIGLMTAQIFNKQIALMSSFLYATIPTIVMANRLSLTENLLTPLSILAILIFCIGEKSNFQRYKPYLLGICCALALLTKNIGIYIPLALLSVYMVKRQYKDALIISIFTVVAASVHPLIGLYYDWNLFTAVIRDYQKAHSLGLPQTIYSIFLYPTIGHKEKIFLDSSMLVGYILFLSSPFWLFKEKENDLMRKIFLFLPFSYLALLSILEGGQITFYGWHLFPLFPFLAILLAKIFYDIWKKQNFLEFLLIFLIIGTSSLRFFLLLVTPIQDYWQHIFVLVLVLFTVIWTVFPKYRKPLLIDTLIIYTLINLFAVFNLNSIYEANAQPLF